MRALVPDTLGAALLQARNPDGGWGYRARKQSRIEPTAFALIALAAARGAHGPAPTSELAAARGAHGPASTSERSAVAAGLDAPAIFASFPRRDGLLIDPGATHPNLAFNAVAALAAQYPPLGARETAADLTGVLLRHRGVMLPPSKIIVQDNTLVGWPWLDGTFAWVEPTAWCLMALKRWTEGRRSADAAERIDHAERLLRDRMCRGGGWNYGNRLVMDKALRPYASTTALALLALQDAPKDAAVTASRGTLKTLCARERSGYALALAALAFARLGAPDAEVEAALAGVWDETSFGGEVVATALALYVASGREGGYEAFRI